MSNWGRFLWSIKWWGQISYEWHECKIALNWDIHHGIEYIKDQIGVVFQGRSNQLCSCINHLTWTKNCCKLRYTPWNWTYYRSNWGSFSRSIKWWGQISCAALQISWHEGKIADWNLLKLINQFSSEFRVGFRLLYSWFDLITGLTLKNYPNLTFEMCNSMV